MGFSVSLDDLLGDEVRRDPYPFYARLHELGEAVALAPTAPYAAVVHGYDAAHRVLRDPVFRVLDADHLDRAGLRWRDHAVIRTLQASMLQRPAPRPRPGPPVVRPGADRPPGRRVGAGDPAHRRPAARPARRRRRGRSAGGLHGRVRVPLPSDVVGELLGVPERDREWFPSRVRAFDAVLEIGPRSVPRDPGRQRRRRGADRLLHRPARRTPGGAARRPRLGPRGHPGRAAPTSCRKPSCWPT